MEKIIDELRELANKLEKEQKTKDNKQDRQLERQGWPYPYIYPYQPTCPCCDPRYP